MSNHYTFNEPLNTIIVFPRLSHSYLCIYLPLFLPTCNPKLICLSLSLSPFIIHIFLSIYIYFYVRKLITYA